MVLYMRLQELLLGGLFLILSSISVRAEGNLGGIENYSSQESNDDELTVKITSGLIQGIEQESTLAFLGVPYAEVERFMPPLPVKPWQGVRRCDHWGPQVMQFTNGRKLSEAEMSEKNSCVLNVWTTDRKAHKPVMLWIHGGGFDSGTSAWNPGMCLAKKDVVVVSLNHRLNILGFLDLSACSEKYKYSGNVGMLDIVAALKWIRDNIAQFGGDSNNVTIFGESGGGGKVGTLLSMPSAKGLFHKAIIMSGTILNVNTKAMSEALGKAVLKELNIDAEHIERINDVSYEDLYAAGQRAMAASIGTRKPGTPMMWGFGPTPDGETLLQQPFQPDFAKISDDVPILIGTTFNELQRLRYNRDISLEEAKEALMPTFGNDTEAYMEAMKQAWPNCTPPDMLSIDWLFRPKTLITADAIAESRKAPTYMYMFTWRSPLNQGSVHGAELMFCFNTLHHAKRDLPQPTDNDLKLADIMSNVWAQFAHNGNPNVQGLPAWQPYTAKTGEMMIFDYQCNILHNPDRRLQEIINKHCFKQLEEFKKSQVNEK
jgi:para-nitrobenzyl esterase